MPAPYTSLRISAIKLRLAAIAAGLLGAFLVPGAQAQVTYTGAAASLNFGTLNLGVASAAQTLTFSVAAGTSVGSIAYLTQGSPGLDFASTSGGTCTATAYASAATCTVNVVFTPQFPGTRGGAVVFFSGTGSTGTVLGTGLVYGLGTGAQVSYQGTTPVYKHAQIDALAIDPGGLATDGAGDLFITDIGNLRIIKVSVGTGDMSYIPLTQGAKYPGQFLAIDSAGNLYTAEDIGAGASQIVEVPIGGGTQIILPKTVEGTALLQATGIVVDTAGDVYVSDTGNDRIVEYPAGGGTAMVLTADLNAPSGLALDGAGDLFAVVNEDDEGYLQQYVTEISQGAVIRTYGNYPFHGQGGIAVDAAGDIYVNNNDYGDGPSVEKVGAAGYQGAYGLTLASGHANALALDSSGNLFIADGISGSASGIYTYTEWPLSTAPAVNFPTQTAVGSTDTTDGIHNEFIYNTGNEPLDLTAFSYAEDFPGIAGYGQPCTTSAVVDPGSYCEISFDFAPINTGQLNEQITITSAGQNVSGGPQAISVSGNINHLAAIDSPIPGTTLPLAAATFSWIDGVGVTQYKLLVGSTGVGSSDIYSGTTTGTSATISVPFGGVELYVRLMQTIGGVTQSVDYTYTEATEITYSGPAASLNFGTLVEGTSGMPQTLTFTIPAGVTVGSIAYLTQGQPDLDFEPAPGGTCAATSYATATTCTLNVTFTPTVPGVRAGSVVLFSGAYKKGTVQGQAFIYGESTGPQIGYLPPVKYGYSGLGQYIYGSGIATGGAGAVYIGVNGSVGTTNFYGTCSLCVNYEWTGPAAQILEMAVDGAGDLYIYENTNPVPPSRSGTTATFIVPVGGGPIIPLPYLGPGQFDKAGNLFISTSTGLVELPAGNGAPVTRNILPGSSFVVDSADNFYSPSGGVILKTPIDGGATSTIASPAYGVGGIAIDGQDNLYVVDPNGYNISEALAGASSFTLLATIPEQVDPTESAQIAVDSLGNVYILAMQETFEEDDPAAFLYTLPRSPVPTFPFPTPVDEGYVSTTYDEARITNLGNAPLVFSAVEYPKDFIATPGKSDVCANATTVAVGAECDLYVSFAPQNSGNLIEDVTLVDNAFANGGGAQPLSVSGYANIAPRAATIISPATGSTLTGATTTFTWTGGEDITEYQLVMGTWGVGAGNLFSAVYPDTTTTVTVPTPADGVTLHVRLNQLIVGKWQSSDYTYTEAGTAVPAVISSPVNGSTLTGTSVTFKWPNAVGPYQYRLLVGTTGPGSSDLFSSYVFSTSQAVTVPANGQPIYVTLGQELNSVWQSAQYTYTEPGAPTAATMTSPTPGTKLLGAAATFKWTSGGGATAYHLLVGTWGKGAADIYNSGVVPQTTTSITVPIPADGVNLYVGLLEEIGGVWSEIDYTYTEAGTTVPAVISSPVAGSKLTSSNVDFSWAGGKGPYQYALKVGTSGPGSSDILNLAPQFATSIILSIPANGSTLYVTLGQEINGVWQTTPYTYTEQGTPVPASLILPAPGSKLAESPVTFTWTSGGGATAYQLYVGTWGAGAGNIYTSAVLASTTSSVTIPVPANGVTLDVRLNQKIAGVWQSTDYLYTEEGTAVPAVISSPAAGSTLTSTNVTFSWANAKGPYEYRMTIGTTAGASDVYDSPFIFTTSQEVTVPAHGARLYVTFGQQLNGVWQTANYMYTESGTP